MNPMLQRHCAKFIYIVPDGLRELMSDISREVIRTQPENIYTFIADYLDALMITRENARIAARLVDSICEIAETTVELLQRIGLSRAQADAVVSIMQTAFREYVEKKKKSPHIEEVPGEWGYEEEDFTHRILSQLPASMERLDEAANVIQNAWRKFKERQEREKQMLFGMVDWRIAARSAILLYRKTGVTMYEANRAATLIKAAYKGYYTRRIMRRLLHMGLEDESTSQIQSTIETEEALDLSTESEEYHEFYRAVETYGEGSSFASRVDYLNLEADIADTQPTGGAIAAAAHSSWTAPTDGQITEEGHTLAMDVEGEVMSPEDGDVEVLPEIRGESQMTVEASGEDSEKVPPNTEQEESEPAEAEAAAVAEAPETAEPDETGVPAEAPEETSPEAPVAEEPAAEIASEPEATAEPAVEEPAAEPSEPTDEPVSEPASEPVTDAEDATTDYTTDDTEAGG